jgi:hypothetical protein
MFSGLIKLIGMLGGQTIVTKFSLPIAFMGIVQTTLEDTLFQTYEQLARLQYNTSVILLPNINLITDKIIDPINLTLLSLSLILFIVIFRLDKIRNFVLFHNIYTSRMIRSYRDTTKGYHHDVLTNVHDIQRVLNHISNHFIDNYPHDDKFRRAYDHIPTDTQTVDMVTFSSMYIPALNQRYYFEDTVRGVTGYISWSQKEAEFTYIKRQICTTAINKIEGGDEKTVIVYYPRLNISVTESVRSYMEYIENINKNLPKVKELYYVKLNRSLIEDTLSITGHKIASYSYTGDFQEYFEREHLLLAEKTYIKTFYHPQASMIWNYVKIIKFNPNAIVTMGQYPQASFCLYGPPGTGKSSLGYRLAMAVGAHVLSVDLRAQSKSDIQSIIYGFRKSVSPFIGNPNVSVSFKPSNTIIVLDEFDQVIKAIKARSDIELLKEKQKEKTLELVMNKYRGLSNISEHVLEGVEKKDIEQKSGERESKDESIDEHEPSEEMDNAMKNYMDTNYYNMTQADLLEMFQGPSANNGSVIIATTNDLKSIITFNPRCLRDGRLTPIYFGYPTKSILDQITTDFFSRSVKDIDFPNTIRISTARITSRATQALLNPVLVSMDDKFAWFIDCIKYDLENNKLSDEYKDYETVYDTISQDSAQYSSNSSMTLDE